MKVCWARRRVPTPDPRFSPAAELEPDVPLQDHQTRRHREHMQAPTEHIRPRTEHIQPKSEHIRRKSEHIGSDGVNTCLDDRNLNLGRSRIRR